MPRGRQYYDPIVQRPDTVQGDPDLSRIELYPVGESEDPRPKWVARRINADGSIAYTSQGDFDQARAQAQAEEMWPGLSVYVLREEGQDSTHEGFGPSPRLWQNAGALPTEIPPAVERPAIWGQTIDDSAERIAEVSGKSVDEVRGLLSKHDQSYEGPPAVEEAVEIHPLVVPEGGIRIDFQEGVYMPLNEIVTLLEAWAVSYEEAKNPSGAVALREAVEALKEIG